VPYIIKTTAFISAVYFLAVNHMLSLKPNPFNFLFDVKFLKNIFIQIKIKFLSFDNILNSG